MGGYMQPGFNNGPMMFEEPGPFGRQGQSLAYENSRRGSRPPQPNPYMHNLPNMNNAIIKNANMNNANMNN